MTVPNVFANGVGNYPDATKFNANYDYLEVLARKNRLINGNFAINQRQATSVADDAYCLDRWYVLTETGNVTVAQMTDVESGTATSIKLTQPDATPKRIGLAQIMESINCRDLQGAAVQFSGKLKCSLSQPVRFAIVGNSGSADVQTSDLVDKWSSANYSNSNFFQGATWPYGVGTITPTAATWTNFSVTATLGYTNNFSVFVWTEGTLAQNGTLELARMAFKPGIEIVHGQSHMHFDIASELVACQRYYEKSYNQGTAPGTASTAGIVYFRSNGTNHYEAVPFKVTKRTTPNVTLYNPNSGSSGSWRDYSASTDKTVTGSNIGESGLMVAVTSSVDGNETGGHYVAEIEL